MGLFFRYNGYMRKVTRLIVFNLAMGFLEQDPVTDVNLASETLEKLRNVEDTARSVLMSSGDFDFARADAELALVDTVTFGEYRKRYRVPVDSLEILFAYKDSLSSNLDEKTEPVEYEIQDDLLLCNEDQVYVKYSKFVDDYSKYDWTFAEALALKMANLSSLSITSSVSKAGYLGQSSSQAGANALNRSIGKSGNKYFRDTTWISERNYRNG